jgi:esterase/lipase superfamily enzyme
VLVFAKSKNRKGKIAIKWIVSAVLGGAGIATVSYTASDKAQVGSRSPQQMASQPISPAPAPTSIETESFASHSPEPASPPTIVLNPQPRIAPGPPLAESSLGTSNANLDEPEVDRSSSSSAFTLTPPRKKKLPAVTEPAGGGMSLPMLPIEESGDRVSAAKRIDEVGRRWVRVFFATDRTRLDLSGPWIPLRLWLPVVMGVALASMFAIGMVAGIRRWIAGLGAVAAMIMTAYFAQQATLGTQTLQLLSKSTQVAFGTSRNASSDHAYPLHVGYSEVTLPPNHRPGTLERPSLFRLELKEDDRKHVTLQRVETMPAEAFFQEIRSTQSNSALVFIHGFNVKFDDALRRTAQLTADLEYSGVPVLYSWPSKGQTVAYTLDEANVGWTVPHLEAFLLDLKSKANVDHIHVVAHSMGNRALLGVVERLGLRSPTAPVLSRVVMAAPDVDSLEFHNRFADLLQQVAAATTVYGSRNDRALLLSESIHGYDRLGLVSDHFGSKDRVDMIDTSPLDLSLLGHSYYGENPLVIDDMKAFLSSRFSANNRPWLKVDAEFAPRRVVWRFAEQSYPPSNLLK